MAHAELEPQLAAAALLHGPQQQLEALAVGRMHVGDEAVGLGRQLAGLEAQGLLDDGAHLDLVAAGVPFPHGGAGAVDRQGAQLLVARLRAAEHRLGRAEGELGDGEADQHHDQHEAGDQAQGDEIARQPPEQRGAGPEQPDQQQHPGGHQRQRAVLPAQRQEQR